MSCRPALLVLLAAAVVLPAASAEAAPQPLLGDSFGDVRVHTDPLAAALARSVQARAFTTGADIFFAGDSYEPGSAQGRALLAHVVQQRGTPTSGDLRVSEPGDQLERDAERAAAAVASR